MRPSLIALMVGLGVAIGSALVAPGYEPFVPVDYIALALLGALPAALCWLVMRIGLMLR